MQGHQPPTCDDKEARERRFARINPFKESPAFDSLAADPWRERDTAIDDFDRRMKKLEKEEHAQFATVGLVQGRIEQLQEDAHDTFRLACDAYTEVRELEHRLRLVLGPIPYPDPNALEGWD